MTHRPPNGLLVFYVRPYLSLRFNGHFSGEPGLADVFWSGLISRFLSSTCTEVSGVENIGQCSRLNQLSWLLGIH